MLFGWFCGGSCWGGLDGGDRWVVFVKEMYCVVFLEYRYIPTYKSMVYKLGVGWIAVACW